MFEKTINISREKNGPKEEFVLSVPTTGEELLELYGEKRALDFVIATHVIRFQGAIRDAWKEHGTAAKAQKEVGTDYMPAEKREVDHMAQAKNAIKSLRAKGATNEEIMAMLEEGEGA